MLLALDVGNSALKGALFDGEDPVRVFSESFGQDGRERGSRLGRLKEKLEQQIDGVSIDRVGMASVVPDTGDAVERLLMAHTDAEMTRVGPSMPLPIDLAYETPETLGADRLAAAVAGWHHFGMGESPRSALVVDAGTAVTFEVVHRDGVYQGGTITAGPALVRRALQNGTAQLPSVALELPDGPIGRSTQRALQSGIMWSLVDSVRGMMDRLAAELPDTPRVLTTGGWGELLVDHIDSIDHYEPHLVLEGIRILTDGAETAN